jgi:drug/metabolite transporter (DMT)-like permease
MILAYLIMCLIYGTTFLGIKLGLNAGFSPFIYASLRFSIAGIILITFLIIKRKMLPRSKRFYIDVAFVGMCMTGLEFAGFYWAQQYIPSSFAALLAASTPLMVTLSNLIIEKQRSSKIEITGILIGLIGMFLIVYPKMEEGFELTNLSLLGAIAIIIAKLFYSIGTIKSRSILAQGFSPTLINGFQMLIGSLFLCVLSLLFESNQLNSGFNFLGISSLLYLIIFGSVIASGIYYWLVKVTNPLLPSTWTYVSPLVALGVGFLWLNEEVQIISLVGLIVVLSGVFLVNFNTFRKYIIQKSIVQTEEKIV